MEAAPHHLDAAGGTQLTFDQVYEAHFDFVYRNVRRLGVPENAADDVVQEVFLILHRRLGEYDGRASLRGWLYGILANTVRGYRRGYRRKQEPLVAELGEEHLALNTANPEQRAQQRQDMRLLLDLLEELPDDQRELIVLADLEQLSVPEICGCIGGNSNTVYSRLRVARDALRAKLSRRRLGAKPKERV